MSEQKLEIVKYTKNPFIPEENQFVAREAYVQLLETLIIENITLFPSGSCVSGKQIDHGLHQMGRSPLFFSTVASSSNLSNNIEQSEKPSCG